MVNVGLVYVYSNNISRILTDALRFGGGLFSFVVTNSWCYHVGAQDGPDPCVQKPISAKH